MRLMFSATLYAAKILASCFTQNDPKYCKIESFSLIEERDSFFADIKKKIGCTGNLLENHNSDTFSLTCASKFLEMTYSELCRLLSFHGDFKNVSCYIKPSKKINIESKVYRLLFHAIRAISPLLYDHYYNAFHSGKYFECFLVLQGLCIGDSDLERFVYDAILIKNKNIRRNSINKVCFIDTKTLHSCCVDLQKCDRGVSFYLPSFVLSFNEFACTSFHMDEMILSQIDMITGCHFRRCYKTLIKSYFMNFHKLNHEDRIIFYLRVKFFAFNSIGYAISHLSTGPVESVYNMLIDKALSENSEFYKYYAIGSGLLK